MQIEMVYLNNKSINQFQEKNKQNKQDYDYMFKVILLGESAVGKSNILLRYTKNEYNQYLTATIGVSYVTKTVTTALGNRIKLQIWELNGQQHYRPLLKIYFKGCLAVLIIYDITQEQSFLRIEKELKFFSRKQILKNDIFTTIVGNKMDKEQHRVVSKQRGLQYAANNNLHFMEVSAKDDTNINLLFTIIARNLQKTHIINEQVNLSGKGQQKYKNQKNKDQLISGNKYIKESIQEKNKFSL